MIRFQVIDAADQQFGAILNRRRVTLRLRYNTTTDRWSFDLSVDNLPVLTGKRIVMGIDLLASYNFDIGQIFAWPAVADAVPDRINLPNGNVRLYHVTDDEAAAARLANAPVLQVFQQTVPGFPQSFVSVTP